MRIFVISIGKDTFIRAGGIVCAMNILVNDAFLSGADDNTKK